MGSQMATTPTSRERLIELIEAYAAAKVSTNATLMQLAASALQQILATISFDIESASAPATDDFTMPPGPVEPATTRRKRAE